MKSLTVNTKRRKQNHKISFLFFSGSPHTPRRKAEKERKEIFGFGLRLEGARGAHCSLHYAIGAYDLGMSHHALRACEVNPQNPADFAHTMFELRPEITATNICYRANPGGLRAMKLLFMPTHVLMGLD